MTEHNAEQPLLEMKGVKIAFASSTGIVEAVRGVNMTIYPGQSVAIVGESGSGKSTTAMSILGLLPGNGKVTEGQIIFEGEDITGFDNKDYEKLRGSHIGLVPQDPMSNLNRCGALAPRSRNPSRPTMWLRDPSAKSALRRYWRKQGFPMPSGARSSTHMSSPAVCASVLSSVSAWQHVRSC